MFNFESSSLSRVRILARADERRSSRRDEGGPCRCTLLNVGAGLDDPRLETGGATDGTAGTAMLGAGGAGILAALPMPLGSLTELLRPPTLPGPRGMPLTPASPAPCAKHGAGAARQPANAKAKQHDLPNIDSTSLQVSITSIARRKRPQRRGLRWGRFEGVSGFHSTDTSFNPKAGNLFPAKPAIRSG